MSKSKRRRQAPRPTAGPPSPRGQSPAELTVRPEPARAGPDSGDGAHIQMLVGLIATGALDEYLGTLQAAITQRHRDHHRTASNQAAARLRIGDRVMLNHDVRPLYLHGATGTVTGWASQNVIVQLDNPTGRFTSGQLRCPPLSLQRLPE